MSLFSITDDRKTYGPLNMPSQTYTCTLSDEQQRYVWKTHRLNVNITYRASWGNLGRVTVHEALPVCFG